MPDLPEHIDLEPLPFDEAIAFFADKVPLTVEEFYALAEEIRARAFTVARVTSMDVIMDVKNAVDRALIDGETLADFTGRLKDLIIIRGRNHHPQDIELTVSKSHPALQPDAGAAFTVPAEEGNERLVIVQEVTRRQRKADGNEVAQAVRRAVAENHELQVHALVLIKPLRIPRTSSGKIQRHA